MVDTKQLPFLLKLIDDDSPLVQEAVVKQFDSYGPSLDIDLMSLSEPPDFLQMTLINDMLGDYRRKRWKTSWANWIKLRESTQKLEAAFQLIADFHNGSSYPFKLNEQLDNLAAEYQVLYTEIDEIKLAKFLFHDKRYSGTEKDYYNYRNSDLIHVINSRKGIPISLACLYKMVGERLGLVIEGFNFPGHFLAKIVYGGEVLLVDGYYRGKILRLQDFERDYVNSPSELEDLLDSPPDATKTISRVLLNLNRSYNQIRDRRNANFVLELLKDLGDYEEDHS